MEIKFAIEYHEKVINDDIPKISKILKKKIQKSIEEKLTTSPEKFGKPLRRSLKNYRKLRVGDYRIIFKITNKKIQILTIQHRSVVYKKSNIKIRLNY